MIADSVIVNEVLMNHNVDKQISDSRGEVAYLMADVSNVQLSDIKEIHDGLEGLSCKSPPLCANTLASLY